MINSNHRWQSVAIASDITTKPSAIIFETDQFILVRLGENAPAVVLRAHCPHRLVPLTAATVV
ncbi:MAG: (2Fe-2S)-binding protein, partial [Antricoccus sp.]